MRVTQQIATAAAWATAVASTTLGALLLLPGGRTTYLIGLSISTTVAAALIATDDYRTGLLRNRWTVPFALAGLIQVVIVAFGTQPWTRIVAPCLIGASITTSLYLLLGLLGWMGFGDVKFAAGLALFVAVPAGWAGLYLLPLALAVSALPRFLRRLVNRPQRSRTAHGPALAAAFAILMLTSIIHQDY